MTVIKMALHYGKLKRVWHVMDKSGAMQAPAYCGAQPFRGEDRFLGLDYLAHCMAYPEKHNPVCQECLRIVLARLSVGLRE